MKPNNKDPIFPSKTLAGYILKNQNAQKEPKNEATGNILSNLPSTNDLIDIVVNSMIERPDWRPLYPECILTRFATTIT